MELHGPWKAIEATEDLRRDFPGFEFDENDWTDIEVPGHWQDTPAFAGSDGPVLYRTRFERDRPGDDERDWLALDGVFYLGDVFLDEAYLGATEGYFFPHTFEVTDQIRDRSEHVLAIEATCAPESDPKAKRNLTGVFQHWDCLDPHRNPGGIWRPVRLERTGPVRIARLRVRCTEASEQSATLSISATLDTAEARVAMVRTTVGAVDQSVEQPLAAGANLLDWTVTIPRPALWWPHALGDQPLHDLAVEVLVDGEPGGNGPGHRLSHRRTLRTGLRSVRMRNWVLSVNGERMFVKGTNLGPTRQDLARASDDDLARDVRLARDAGLDLIRVHAHVTRPEFYAAADRAGMLVWQDMPLQWTYSRSVRKQAIRQAQELVDVCGHHPSVVIWCGHNEPFPITDTGGDEMATTWGLVKTGVRIVAHQQLPTWNKSILDRSIKRVITKADGTRPVIPHSGIWPHAPLWDGTDSHTYFGWYHGDERDFPTMARVIPRMVRWVSEFGAQAVPDTDDFMGAEAWPDLDWDRLGERHALQKMFFDQHVPPGDHAGYQEWKDATQRYQATVARHHIEYLRRIKYRPTGGFCHFSFADGVPAVTWSVLDHERVPKPAYHAIAQACRPVIVTADRPPAQVKPGRALRLDVHVVSDLRSPYSQAQVVATMSWPGGQHRWGWKGDIPADECTRVGTIDFTVPESPGPLRLDLDLSCGSIQASNQYETQIT